MGQFFTALNAVCRKLLEAFIQSRLMAELPAADELILRRIDRACDDPSWAGGSPIVGVL